MSENNAAISKEQGDGDSIVATRVETLGTVRLRHHQTNEVILIPKPSDDPNDPLNWYGFSPEYMPL